MAHAESTEHGTERRWPGRAAGIGLTILGAYSIFAALVLLVVGGTDPAGFVSDWRAVALFTGLALLGGVLVRRGVALVRRWRREIS